MSVVFVEDANYKSGADSPTGRARIAKLGDEL
jgi:hypothetical protein